MLRREMDDTVFQYAGDNVKYADRLYGWGCAATGALGLKTLIKPERRQKVRLTQLTPLRIDFSHHHRVKVKHMSCGYGFTSYLCQTPEGKHLLYGTGLNTDSQLGYQEFPRKSGRILDYMIEPASISLPLSSPNKTNLTHVACGRAHLVVATDKEGVFTLGHNAYGQCGRTIVENESYRGSQVINKVPFTEPIKQVVCGQDHTLLLTDSGQVYSFGLGSDGQTGLGTYENISSPTLVKGDIEGEKIVSISSRADTVLAVSDRGDLFGWGNSEYDQLSVVIGDRIQLNVPCHLPFGNAVGKVKKAAAAGSMCAVLNENGSVFTWGFGILGKGPKLEKSKTPEQIPQSLFGLNDLNPTAKVVDISCGLYHFAALTDSGALYVWGKNRTACLGLGHVLDQFFPYKVQVPAEVKSIGCGVDHMIVLCKSFG